MLKKLYKLNLLHFIPLNLILLIYATLHFHDQSPVSYYSYSLDLIYSCLLLIIGTIVYTFAEKRKDSLIFFIMMIFTGWILIFLHSNNLFFIGLSRILMCIDIILLFIFFSYFSDLDKKKIYSSYLKIIVALSFITNILLLTFIPILRYSLFILIFFLIVLCCLLSFSNRTSQRLFSRKYQKILLIAIMVALAPFIFLRFFVQNPIFIHISFYSFISLPIVIAYIFLKKNKLQIKSDYKLMGITVFVFLVINLTFILFCLTVVNLNLIDTFTLLVFLYILIYVFRFYQRFMLKKQIHSINSVKQTFERERLEILQKITYDDYLESLNSVILELIQKTILLKGSMIVWKEDNHSFVLNQSGIFTGIPITKKTIGQLQYTFSTIVINDCRYLSFPLIYENNLCGWLIVGERMNGNPFSKEDIEILLLLSKTIGEIFKTTEILHQTQNKYTALPTENYDEQLNLIIQIKNDELRKSLSLYLHDEILQNILALKNLSEMLQTPQLQEKELILNTFISLTNSLRDKMFDIYPSTLINLSFYNSISILCEKMETSSLAFPNVSIQLFMEIDLIIPVYLRFPLYRTIKELIQNSLKHADASTISVTIKSGTDKLSMKVEDDGIGIDLNEYLQRKGHSNTGLLSIKQEINLLNGQFLIDNHRKIGACFQIKLPLNEENRVKYENYTF